MRMVRAEVWILVLGCGVTAASCTDDPPAAKRKVFRADVDPVRVQVGEVFALEIDDNSTVSPDYRRELQEPLPGCLRLISMEYPSQSGGSHAPGSGGTKRWILQAIETGDVKLLIKYRAKEDGTSGDPGILSHIVIAGK
jgi:predicted secreted protein